CSEEPNYTPPAKNRQLKSERFLQKITQRKVFQSNFIQYILQKSNTQYKYSNKTAVQKDGCFSTSGCLNHAALIDALC
ncbi:MAG: hypothetical protein Q4E77_03080, partial [Conchiformibius sp.]|nr:hypothetical protein [Conchiformibius sp.]